ncbi:MAG: 30S ribosomal protein S27ae [Candidatus Micrarchaeota archaeon]|nr:30S ribosomal protein S27ae [Candidatus Micrarchaeota archaeon]MDE1847324.1 30S ribosomal protein S27ae [Candidatus Micrarchaeota archaeon]MDE1863939.1 30S ribosomal protein S27ae [Candidatus Micrarchaeota archaeon]
MAEEKKGAAPKAEAGKKKEKAKKQFKPYTPGRQCSKCGSRMAEHSDRNTCGKCGYMEIRQKGDASAKKN